MDRDKDMFGCVILFREVCLFMAICFLGGFGIICTMMSCQLSLDPSAYNWSHDVNEGCEGCN